MTDWQPIETNIEPGQKPFDGEPVLILTDHNYGGPLNRVHRAFWTDVIYGDGIFGWAVDDCKHGPYPLRGYAVVSHWMPLPPPPETSK